jgi:putative membrane protein
MRHVTLSLGAAIVVCVVVGCSRNDSGAADTAGSGASTAAMASQSPPVAGASTSAAGGLTDPNIVYILDQANAADSARGKVAQTKGTSAAVKRFGAMMVGEHHGLRVKGQQLAKKLGVTPQAPSGDQSEAQAKQESDSLSAVAKGAAWDKAYIDYEVTYHQQVLQTATQALGATQNAELKQLIQSAAPVIQRHLDEAKRIQGTLK